MSEGYLTTHVLDTARGLPAEGIEITLYRLLGAGREKIAARMTNADGRTDSPILPAGEMTAGQYELVFACGTYFDRQGLTEAKPKFLDEIPIRFGIDNAEAHYHVPLLLSPFGYSTYRGS